MSTVAIDPAAQQRLQTASTAYNALQAQLQDAVGARSKLGAQATENEAVQAEFKSLGPDNEVFKRIGPVLVKQDTAEAKANVDKRLEFIRGEIKRVETQITDLEGKSDAKRNEIGQIQSSIQSALQPAQGQA